MEFNSANRFPEVMSGKKILYVHGFASSGQSCTVDRIRYLLPGVEVVAPDLPLRPDEALALLRRVCDAERPDLVIGTSMGGMYAEMLYGYDRILVNPAFRMGETMLKHGMIGKNTYSNPRADGEREFIVTKALVEEYRQMTAQCFAGVTSEESRERVYGLFGDSDPVVHTRDLFSQYYRNDIEFHGEHRLNDKILVNSVLPVIRWIDDRQEGRQRPIVLIDIDAMRDERGNQRSSAMKAARHLLESYNLLFVAPAPTNDPRYMEEVTLWARDVISVPAWNRLIFTNRTDLVYADYLVSTRGDDASDGFMGTTITLGSDTFKTWEEIIEFFGRLGGQ